MLWLRKNRTIKSWLLFPGSVFISAGLVFVIIAFSTHQGVVDAQVVNFYSHTCDGEWSNPQNATGEPDVRDDNIPYSQGNAAYLEGATRPLTCYGFSGTLPSHTYHTRVQVRFSWHQEHSVNAATSLPVVSDEITEAVLDVTSESVHAEATSTSAVDKPNDQALEQIGSTTIATTSSSESLDVSETENATSGPEDANEEATSTPVTVEPIETQNELVPETVIEPSAASDPEAAVTISWFDHVFGKKVYAEELSVSTTTDSFTLAEGAATTTPVSHIAVETALLSTSHVSAEATSSYTVSDGVQFMIEYSLDADTWESLGVITTVENDVRLEFPTGVLATLADISNVQLRLVPVGAVDVRPVYVDAVWLEVSYAPLGELGMHSISNIIPEIAPIASVISEDVVDASSTIPHLTPQDFVNRIQSIHGIDEQYVLVTLTVTATSGEIWLFDMSDELIHRIGSDAADIGIMPAGMKDGMIFWLNATEEKIFTYDLRTAGSLHEMLLVQNLPPGRSYRLAFPFTDWELVWRGDRFYFFSQKTGEVFQDENTRSAQLFFEYFPLLATLPLERIQDIGVTFITESDLAPHEVTSRTIE